jgi:F-type H+-transporting ATPase subunit b
MTMNFVKNTWRVGLLALLAMNCVLSGVCLRAQDQPAAPPSQQNSNNSTSRPSFAQQLAHETREAAGEDKADNNDTAAFKQSGAVRFIAKKLGISVETASLLSFLFNFAVIAGIILWVGRKHLPGLFSARTAAIQKAMQEAQKASEEARRRLADIESRLMRLDGEIGMMRDTAEKEAAAEEARIHTAVQEESRKIVEGAQQEIASAAKAARRELTAYAADLAVGLAQKQIRVDAATDQALVRNFAGHLGTSSSESADAARKDKH